MMQLSHRCHHRSAVTPVFVVDVLDDFFAAFVFTGRRYRGIRWGLLASAALCLVGLVGPATGVLAWRGLGIVGYVVVFPVTCIALGRAISPVVKGPPSGVSVRSELAAHRS